MIDVIDRYLLALRWYYVGGRRDFSRFDPRPAGHAPSTLELCPLCPDMSGHCLDTVDLEAGSKPVSCVMRRESLVSACRVIKYCMYIKY